MKLSAMSRSVVLAVAFATSVVGCALVIDLGDEPKLATGSDAAVDSTTPVTGTDSSASTPDTGTPDTGGPAFQCGLPPSPNASCQACINQNCCDVSKACATNPKCVEGLDCIKHCLVQVNCVNSCLAKFPEVADVSTCSAFQCTKCTPGVECSNLGKCVFDLPQSNLLRLAQEGRILNLDEAVCKSARLQAAADGVADAGVCFEP